MFFKSVLFLAMVTLIFARPNPSSLKTIASASGSKSSIKSPSQKLAEKNNNVNGPSVASIVEIPLQSQTSQSVSQSESLSINLQGQDADSVLQYAKHVPTVYKNDKVLESPSSVQNEIIKPLLVKKMENSEPALNEANLSHYSSNIPVVSEKVETVVGNVPVISEVKPSVREESVVPAVVASVVEHKPVVESVVVEPKPVVKEEVSVAQSVPSVVPENVVPLAREESVVPAVVEHKPVVEPKQVVPENVVPVVPVVSNVVPVENQPPAPVENQPPAPVENQPPAPVENQPPVPVEEVKPVVV